MSQHRGSFAFIYIIDRTEFSTQQTPSHRVIHLNDPLVQRQPASLTGVWRTNTTGHFVAPAFVYKTISESIGILSSGEHTQTHTPLRSATVATMA